MRSFPRRFLSLLVPLFGATPLIAQAPQTGMVQGKVTVEGIGRPLANAMVSVVGTQVGAQTNEAGEYRLTNVPAGPRVIRVQRLGFSPATANVTVESGRTATVDLVVREAPSPSNRWW